MSLICYYFGIQQWGKNFRAPRSVQNIQRLFCYSCIFYQKQLFQLLLLNNKLPPNLATWINHFILTKILESHQEFEEGVFPQSSSANGVWLLLGVHSGLSHLKTQELEIRDGCLTWLAGGVGSRLRSQPWRSRGSFISNMAAYPSASMPRKPLGRSMFPEPASEVMQHRFCCRFSFMCLVTKFGADYRRRGAEGSNNFTIFRYIPWRLSLSMCHELFL